VRVFILSDMEGVAGITKWEQVSGGEPLYEEGRRLYTEEVNAAVRGAAAAGAEEIVVMDCHGAGKGWTFNSLLPEALDPRCEFVVQREWTEYTGLLEEGCDAALLVAMHAMAGTPDGVMSHTVSGTEWRNLRFNGTLVGETGINAALCGHWRCPVLMVTGDAAVCEEATELLGPGLTTVVVTGGSAHDLASEASLVADGVLWFVEAQGLMRAVTCSAQIAKLCSDAHRQSTQVKPGRRSDRGALAPVGRSRQVEPVQRLVHMS
jgi:D-aminopeptidase